MADASDTPDIEILTPYSRSLGIELSEWEDGAPWTDFTHKRTEFNVLQAGQHLVTSPA